MYIPSENVKWYSHSEKNLAVSYKTQHTYHKTQQSHSWAFIPEK